jgi:AraC-like DNA-binding protein
MAGFRACLRCRPAGIAAEANTVAKVCAHLGTNLDRKVTLGELAGVTGVSPFTVQRLFQRVLGVSPQEYQRELRAQALRRELTDKDKRVTDAIYDAGYSSSSRAYEDVTKRLGMSPRAYRGRGRGEQIGFATADSPLGRLLVAATSRGLCSVMMGARFELMTQLRAQIPGSKLRALKVVEWPRAGVVADDRASGGDGPGARHPGYGVSNAGMAGAAGDSPGRDAQLQRGCGGVGKSKGGAGGGKSLRFQSRRGRDSLPSRGGQQWQLTDTAVDRRARETAGKRDSSAGQHLKHQGCRQWQPFLYP